MARTKADRPTYRALVSFATGRSGFVAEGTRTKTPVGSMRYWTVDDGDDVAFQQAQLQLGLEVERENAARNARQSEPAAPRTGKVRCIRSFVTHLGYEVREGDVYDADATDVVECPENFESI